MPRVRRVLVAAVVAAGLLGPATPVLARDGRRPGPANTPTTTTTSVPGIDVGHGGDVAGARPPTSDLTVDPVDPDTASQVIEISTEEAAARRAEARAALDELEARIDREAADLRAFGRLTDDLVIEQREVAHAALAAHRLLLRHAVASYVSGNRPEIESAYGAVDPNDVEARTTLVQAVMEADRDRAERLLARRMEVTSLLSRVLEQAAQTRLELAVARSQRRGLRIRLDAADFVLDVLRAGSDIVITGFVFPVADPHTFSSTFGAPRSGGRTHEGNDIFAPMGTPLLAAERGVLDNIGTGTLGGIKLWVVGESGTHYYYAHLIAYAEGIHEGMVVEAGEVIGYVGNTGNAISTPPHLHFEIHPDGGEAIDPYPLLHAVDQVDGRHVLPPRVA
jgi:murein DD-endopeptidase MepM/ murein hydrolase activator NlpD